MEDTNFVPRLVYYWTVRCFGKFANMLRVRFGKKKPVSKAPLGQGA